MKLTVGKLRHERMIKLILWMLRNGNVITIAQLLEFYPKWELNKRIFPTGILKRTKKGHYSLDIELLKKCVYVVTPELYESMKIRKPEQEAKAIRRRRRYAANKRPVDRTVDPDPLSIANILIPELKIKPGWNKGGTRP